MIHNNIALIEQFSAAVSASPRDLEGARRLLHPEFVIREAPSLPFGGDHFGLEGFLHVMESAGALYEFVRGRENLAPTYLEIDEQTVLMRVETQARLKATGKLFPMRVAEFFVFRDELLAEIDVFYWDTAAMSGHSTQAGH
ncbi:nuclear transport factor 2 family protein [Nocardioides sp. GXZ039]|uniref:nuclear transport factor 2 family protein n=1 Tax=Nocardioides sp. GXZ039 TaxID=3136018 RepID=UPI0030F47DAD